jgi:hypothetical protein
MARSALLLDASLLAGDPTPSAVAFLKRMNTSAVALVALGPIEAPAWLARDVRLDYIVNEAIAWRAKELLAALRAVSADPTASWVVCSAPAAIAAAATAGLAGVVLIGVEVPAGDHGLAVNAARDLADVPRALIPRGGGCWHEQPETRSEKPEA